MVWWEDNTDEMGQMEVVSWPGPDQALGALACP